MRQDGHLPDFRRWLNTHFLDHRCAERYLIFSKARVCVCVSCFRFVYGCVSDARRKASASEMPPSLPLDTAIASAKAASVIVMQRVGFMG